MKATFRTGLVGIWLVLIGMLVWRNVDHAPAPERLPPISAGAVAETEEWMGIYHSGRKIGYAHQEVSGDGSGYLFVEDSLLRLTVLDTPQTVRATVRAHTTAEFALRRVQFELVSNGLAFRASGESDDASLRLSTVVGGEESRIDIPLEAPIYLAAGARRFVAARSLQPGKRFAAEVFDPSLLRARRITLSVGGREEVPDTSPVQTAWRIEEEYEGITAVAWVDDDGRVVREQGPLGLVSVRETQEEAVSSNWEEGTVLDVVSSAAIPVGTDLGDPAALDQVRLRLGGVDLSRVPVDTRQRLAGDVLTVRREAVPAAASYRLPYDADERRADLASSPLLQSDHPRIRALAGDVLQGETRPVRAARMLADFVWGRLEKVPTVSVPSALHVLESGRGDCNEHAVLFAALARAAGLPTRVVAGVVYLDGAFYYHAWDEVWLDDWVSVDTALGQFPADPTHLKFVSGEPEDHFQMIRIIGRLSIEVLPG